MSEPRMLLVGDNPFHGVSHLSQERARTRGAGVSSPSLAAEVLVAAAHSGAAGFIFSVNETTLDILRALARRPDRPSLQLYAIAPYSYGFVRTANRVGGTPGLVKSIAQEVVLSANWRAIFGGVVGLLRSDPAALLRAYLAYEVSRVRSSFRRAELASVLLHEIVTDMALGLELEPLFRWYLAAVRGLGLRPGFDTRNLPRLVHAFRRWGIDLQGIVIAAPFNAVGFQMAPSREECEEALAQVPEATVIAFSVLAAGYLSPRKALEYVAGLPHLQGVALGASSVEQAQETFRVFRGSSSNNS